MTRYEAGQEDWFASGSRRPERSPAATPEDLVAQVLAGPSPGDGRAGATSPRAQPWRNGAVEHFQDVFDKSFFRTERYRDLGHLTERAASFEDFHNASHRYSTLGGRTPDEAWAVSGRGGLPPDGYRAQKPLKQLRPRGVGPAIRPIRP